MHRHCALAEILPKPPTLTDLVMEYQSSTSVPTSVTTVPPITIHMLRVMLDVSMNCLLAE